MNVQRLNRVLASTKQWQNEPSLDGLSATVLQGPACHVSWTRCKQCLTWIVRPPDAHRHFCCPGCETIWRARHEEVRVCAYVDCCKGPKGQAAFLVSKRSSRKKFCSDECCALAYAARQGMVTLGGSVRQRTRGRPAKYANAFEYRLECIRRDRERWARQPEPAAPPPSPAPRLRPLRSESEGFLRSVARLVLEGRTVTVRRVDDYAFSDGKGTEVQPMRPHPEYAER